jgi:hypothetical protein
LNAHLAPSRAYAATSARSPAAEPYRKYSPGLCSWPVDGL